MRERLLERTRPGTGTQARGHPWPGPLVAVVAPGRRPPRTSPGDDRTIAQGSRSPVLVVDGYVRPSGDGPWTPSSAAIQRGQIARWAAARGWRLGRVFEEPPSLGLADARPLLAEALDRVESRESDGIAIARLHHIGCSLGQALSAIERIQAAGGTFVSICDGIDLSTPTGRLILRLLLSMEYW
jgi:Resolvase, N terminal domain